MGWHRLLGLLLAVTLLLFVTSPARGEPPSPGDIPEVLRPWTSWVLSGTEAERCPSLLGSSDVTRCIWPAKLSLNLDEHGGRFEQRFHVDAKGWVPLPGDDGRFPLDVADSGKRLVVVTNDGVPRVTLEPGDHTISGRFAWDALPESLAIPPETGLVSLSLSGAPVAEPSRDEGGRIFLQNSARADESERLEVLVHRRVTDEVPLLLTTRIILNVAGKSREVVLGKSLPGGFVPMSITSDLPARIEGDARLRVQVRPGTWTLEVVARSEGPASAIARQAPGGPWREGEEVWVFDARPSLRLTSVEGVRAIDPEQTSLPGAWKNLPAYSVAEGEVMRLVEKRRGDVEPEPDQLKLQRSLWLDFDGKGYTENDTITGTFHRATRLEMNPGTVLGRVAIDGADQFITRGKSGKAGVEIPQGDVRIAVDSRVPSGMRDVPALGYDHDFHEVTTTLNLPPGYRLLHVSGADEVPGTWVRHWTLLEIFLVLVLALAFGKLFGTTWALISGLTFMLVFPETESPEWIWAVALAAVALVRVIPEGRVRRMFFGGQLAILVALVLVALPFIVQHVREGIYPALAQTQGYANDIMVEKEAEQVTAPAAAAVPVPPPPAARPPEEKGMVGEAAPSAQSTAPRDEEPKAQKPAQSLTSRSKSGGISSSSDYRLKAEAYDPNAMVQTGPGLPKWHWWTTSIRFSGPVARSQKLHLYLVPPDVNLVLALVRAFLIVLVFLRLLPRLPGAIRKGPTAPAATAVAIAVLAISQPAKAEIPPTELLDDLKTRLLEKPDCLPECAASPRMLLTVRGDVLRARLEIAAAATTAVPMPGGASQWIPERVTVDGAEASGLARGPDGALFLRLSPGLHDVVVEGALPKRESIQIALPLKPHFVEADVTGFTLEGLHEDGIADDHLQLTRDHVEEGGMHGALAPGVLPPFVRVTRTLHIGLSWQTETQVTRATPQGTAVVLELPLLPGESVTSPNVRVEASRALVNMAPDQTEVSWKSVLSERSPIVLVAPKTTAWAEVWRLDVSPLWHATTLGLAVVHSEAGARVPEWRPWPGESVKVDLVRPPGVAGQTLTIDASDFDVRPGLRALDGTMAFTVRSSRGTDHTVRLPEGADLESVVVNGTAQPLRKQGTAVTLSIAPGTATVAIGFRVPRGITSVFRVPKFDFGAPSVNATTRVSFSNARWILFVRGPRLGPAVLFWSLLLVLGLVAYGLGALRWVPLARSEWMLLAIGLSQIPLPVAAIVVGWLVALGYRRRWPHLPPLVFDLRQLLLVAWTVLALGILVFAVHQGLMGAPDMQIRGNGSDAEMLQWFDDRTASIPDQPLVISVPMLAYRAAMLLWALWLAIAVLKWLRFGWTSFSTEGVWKKRIRARKVSPPPATAPRPDSTSASESENDAVKPA